MDTAIDGLHHVTAIASDAHATTGFYRRLLGLRLVKQTVNHDDPETMHLYFGDDRGTPGSPMTFFVGTDEEREDGRFGAGQTSEVAFAIPSSALSFWEERLGDASVDVERVRRFGEEALLFEDPDGISLSLVADDGAPDEAYQPWGDSEVAGEHQIMGFYGVVLALADVADTAALLAETMGYEAVEDDGDTHRLRAACEGRAAAIELQPTPAPRGVMGPGTVHHIAFRVPDEEALLTWRQRLIDADLSPTDPIDRHYFTSIYAREPGGVLFEFATEGPGFDRDEPTDEIGESLVLPPQLEDRRQELQELLPTL